jgi:tetratricopeptide (TPR) repeat protein
MLDGQIRRHPHSATLLVARGDAVLYEHKLSGGRGAYEGAAERALVWYRRAQQLHERGCRLPDRDHYYLRMGSAYAHLRRRQPAPALAQLRLARKLWPDSAEVTYHLARAYCLDNELDKCLEHFETTVKLAKLLRRPRFLRTYHSVDDWIRRSKTQSEFGLLRQSPGYARIVRQARALPGGLPR